MVVVSTFLFMLKHRFWAMSFIFSCALADWKKLFRRASYISPLVSKLSSPLDLFVCDVSGYFYPSRYELWHGLINLKSFVHICLFCLQALTILAFRKEKINLKTFKIILSIGPTFAIMNFIESMLSTFWHCYSVTAVLSSFFQVFYYLVHCSLILIIFCTCRFFRCIAYVWGLHHSKRHGSLKASY